MAVFSIESNKFMGMSHEGPVSFDGESTVTLTDEQVQTLIGLIRQHGTADVDELELAETHPDIYDTLDEAYRSMAVDAEEHGMLWDGYRSGYFEYDREELKDYCRENCGFKFDYSPDILEDIDPEDIESFYEDYFSEDEDEVFDEWLDGYLNSLGDDVYSFFYAHMNADLDLDGIDYDVCIPQAIVEMARASK